MDPGQISRWLDGNLWKFDGPEMFLGDEPGSARKPWDGAQARVLLAASWPYMQACLAGDSLVLAEGSGPVRLSTAFKEVTPSAVDSGGRLEALGGIYSNGVRPVVSVECQGGFGVVCTPDHQLLVARPAEWRKHGPSRTALAREAREEWVQAGDLRPGDVLKTYYGQNLWAAERVHLPEESFGRQPGAGRGASSDVRVPCELDEDLAWLLGLLATDGSIRWQHGSGMSAALRWSADDEGVLRELLEVVPRVFGKAPCVVGRADRSTLVVELASTHVVRWLRDAVGLTERRRIPDAVFRSPREVVVAYLRGLFDGDGDSLCGAPGFANTEKSLVRDAAVLLANAGCPVSAYSGQPRGTEVHGGRDISFRPVWRLRALWAADMDWAWLRYAHSTRSRELAQWQARVPAQPGRCKASDGVSFMKVSAVVPAGEEEVFDLNVPSVQCFTANGLVAHNSGNSSIPVVYRTVNRSERFLCDRYYLPATPRDFRLLEGGGLPVFGTESRHPVHDFDVFATSISYTVLWVNFVQYLRVSGIPLRWRGRQGDPGAYPMVMAGGQAWSHPEFMAPVTDCVFLGEAEDAPGNPGIAAVCGAVADMKADGLWRAERVMCYKMLAKEFNFLYFPRFTEVGYRYEDRGLPEPTKMVAGYRSTLEGLGTRFRKRYVKDLDSVPPHTEAPLLYSDPGMGAGDIEAGKGCDAWSVPQDSLVEVAGRGSVPFRTVLAGERIRVGAEYRPVAGVVLHGEKPTVAVQTAQGHELECTAEHEILAVRGPVPEGAGGKREWLDAAPRTWVPAEDLRTGDFLLRTVGGTEWPGRPVPVLFAELEHRVGRGRTLRYYGTLFPQEVTPDLGWFLGMVTGDCYIRGNQLEFRMESRAAALVSRLRRTVKQLFDVDLTEYPSREGDSAHLNLNSARLVRWLASNFGIRDSASRKRVPEVIFRSPQPVAAAYLSALYDCNGTSLIPKSGTSSVTIRFAAASEDQVRGVAELLRLLGLPSAVRSEARDVKRDGTPAARPVWQWECRTTGSDQPEAYDWLESLEPFKSRHLGQFRPPQANAAAQHGLQYLAVTSVVPRRVTAVMDVDVPGPQAFNVLGVYVHNCSFCHATYVDKPPREHSVPYLVDQAREWRRNMGSNELSPYGLDFPFFSKKKELLGALLEQVSDEVDTGAMRVDDFIEDPDYSMLLAFGGTDAITLGLEGNSLSSGNCYILEGEGIVRMDETTALEGSTMSVARARAEAAGDGVVLPEEAVERHDRFRVSVGARLAECTRAWKTGEDRPDLVRVRFSDGRSLECTGDHLVAVARPDTSRRYDGQRAALDSGSQEWVAAAEMVPGMKVRTFYGQECWGPVRALQPVPVVLGGRGNRTAPVSFPETLVPDLAWLLGLLATDGDITYAGVRWRVDDAGVEARVRRCCRELFAREVASDAGREPQERFPVRLNVNSLPLVRWLSLNFGLRKGDHRRKVPWQVRRSTRQVAEQFVTGVFDGDGWVGREDPLRPSWGISESGECEEFHSDLQVLLANLGLHSTRRRQGPSGEWGRNDKHTLRVSAEDGYDWSWFQPTETGRAAVWHPPLADRTKLLWMAPADGHAYTKVVAVDPVDGLHAVYDLEVPETSAFTANGIVVHNSQRMRDLIGKGVSDADVEEAVTRAIRAGIRKIKLFMISNMPGEEEGDVMRIVRLGQRLAEIREQMGQPGVRIQMSWTPLLIEAQTPMQWFAPTAPDYMLQQAMAGLRDQHVEVKLGAKAQPEKIALFQACQRASRDAGEAITDVLEDLGSGCWGGVAKDMKDRLNAALRNHGFRNGLGDLFGERFEHDLLGWEHIDTRVSRSLMWGAYRHMVAFLEGTDAESYDSQFDEHYRGGEWIARCNQHCSGNACGCCDREDLQIRQGHVRAVDRDLEARPVQPLDQTTVACKARFSYTRTEKHRFVSNAHWKFAIRRAAYRAQEAAGDFPYIAKRSVRIVSDAYKFRDRSAGIDYAEFGLTRPVSPAALGVFMAGMAAELAPWLDVRDWALYPRESRLPATPVSFWELEVDGSEQELAAALRGYDEAAEVPVLLRQESFYSGLSAEEADAKDHIADAWLARDADRLLLRMILNGKLGPYQAYAPLCGRKSWVAAMRHTARRLAFFDTADPLQGSLLRPACAGCGAAVPAGLLGEVFDRDYCPRCRDEAGPGFAGGLRRPV